MQLVVTGALPRPSTAENEKYPWGPWQCDYQDGLLKKDGERILQSLANLRHVQCVVSARTEKRETAKSQRAAAKQIVAAQAAGAQPSQPSADEVEAPTSAPASAKKQTSVRSKRGKGRS